MKSSIYFHDCVSIVFIVFFVTDKLFPKNKLDDKIWTHRIFITIIFNTNYINVNILV